MVVFCNISISNIVICLEKPVYLFIYLFPFGRARQGSWSPCSTPTPDILYTRGCPEVRRTISAQCTLCRSVLWSIYWDFYFERALNNSNFNIGVKGSVSSCTRSLKNNPKENPTGVGVLSNHVLLCQKCSVFTVNTAETAAEPSRWLAASPCWLIPLINRFTEMYSRRSTRLLPELIVGVKERVSKF